MGKLVPILIVVFLVWLLFFHRSVPRLGRRAGRQIRDLGRAGQELVDGTEVPGSPLAQYETQAGKALTARILLENPLSPDPRVQDRVLRIGRSLAAHSARREVRYRFAVLESAEPLAMAIPGGSVFLTRGLVDLIGPADDRLAGVLGHEVAHIECRHAARSLATRLLARTGMRLLTLGRSVIVGQVAGELERFLGEGYSREREHEADRAGAELAARAGYDRDGLASFLEELFVQHGAAAQQVAFFRTHPPLALRVRALRSA